MAAFGPEGAALPAVMVGQGCDECRGTGFRGRTGIYELFSVDDEIRAEIQSQRGTRRLRTLAIERGMVPLRADGLRLVREGVTTSEEVLRITAE
jgi:general secretion pathway protein E